MRLYLEEDAARWTTASHTATYTLLDSTGTAVTGLDAVAATLEDDGEFTYQITAALISGEGFSDEYTSVWSVSLGGSVVHESDIEALIVRRKPLCPYTDNDLREAHPELFANPDMLPSGWPSWQTPIDKVWRAAISRGLSAGVHVHEVKSWYAWYEYIERKALQSIAFVLMTLRTGATKWQLIWESTSLTEEDPRSAEFAWKQITFRTDVNQDGTVDTTGESESRPGVHRATSDTEAGRGF